MEKIPSFQINHLLLKRGVYVSRKDQVGSATITTFDIRMKAPNREPVMDQAAMHSIEHLAATYLRNDPQWKNRIIYWGPMGCLTGCYLLLEGDLEPSDILDLLRATFRFIATFQGPVPGATTRDCGNAHLHDLNVARAEATKFLNEVLDHIAPDRMQYPQ